MNTVQVGQKSYEMPPRDGFTVAHFLTVADIDRSARFYEKVFGGRILSSGDSSGAPAYIQFANTWLLVNVGGGPTPDVVGNQQCRVFGNRECREIGNTSAEFAKGIFPVVIVKKWFSDFPAYSSFRSGL
jgi:catechol 2,3-dioxygenase-like lactoylglutathione lyase family enzyme